MSQKKTLAGRIGAIFSSTTGYLANLRDNIDNLKQQRDQIVNGRLTKAETIKRLNEFVDDEAASFDANYRFANAASTHDATPRDITGFQIFGNDAGPLLCWLLGDAIKHRLSEMVEESNLSEGITASKRQEVIAEIEARIYSLEVEEETIITDAEEAGMEIPRREGCDPRVVLEVKD